jgi:hypothetical protein
MATQYVSERGSVVGEFSCIPRTAIRPDIGFGASGRWDTRYAKHSYADVRNLISVMTPILKRAWHRWVGVLGRH